MMVSKIWDQISRKQCLENVASDTALRRCLSVFDLTLMGLGSMIGSGIYVMTGKVIKEQAGPGIVVSFILAACIVLMVAGCFTEFAARIHHTGSTYLYVYLSLGELPAFLVGFVNLSVCILSGATNARAWSSYLDSLFNGSISNYTKSHLNEWTVGGPIAQYPDFIAMGLMLIMTAVIALGAKCSSWFNTLFALVNVAILCFVITVGFMYADLSNWTGNFFPHGFSGVMSGAAVCFWAFSGFEILSCAVEEAHDPKRDIPIATAVALVIVTILYVGTTASLTIMTPYSDIDTAAPLPTAFAAQHLYWAQVIVSLGPLCGLTTTLMSSLYGFVRISYKISEDGLLFPFLSRLNIYTQVPVWSIIFCGGTTAIISLFFDLSELISFTVILILMSYCLVCGGVIILRYRPQANCSTNTATVKNLETRTSTTNGAEGTILTFNSNVEDDHMLNVRNKKAKPKLQSIADGEESCDQENLLKITNYCDDDDDNDDDDDDNDDDAHGESEGKHVWSRHSEETVIAGQIKGACLWLWPCNKLSPGRWALISVFIMTIVTPAAAVILVYHWNSLKHGTWWLICLLALCMLIIILTVATLYAHHQSIKGLIIKMPCVPLVPSFSICVCLYLLVATATTANWIGCFILLVLGLVTYFSYSIRHSKLNQKPYHPLPLDSVEEECVNLLADETQETSLDSGNL